MNSVLQILPTFEKGESFWRYKCFFTGFRIPTGVSLVFFDKNGTKSSYFNSITIDHCIGHFRKEGSDNFIGLVFGKVTSVFDSLNQFQLFKCLFSASKFCILSIVIHPVYGELSGNQGHGLLSAVQLLPRLFHRAH